MLSVPDGESLIGSKGGWRGVMNLKPKLLVQELVTSCYKKDEVKRSRLDSMEQGGVFGCEKQEGGHGLKEKDLHDPRELGGYSRRGSNLLRSMMKDEEAISKAASSVEVIGEWLKHPHVAQATRWRLYKKKKQPRLSKRSCISKKRLIWCVRALQPNKRVFLGEVFNEEVLQGSKLDLGSARVKLEGECFGRVLRLQKWSDECAKIGLSPGVRLEKFGQDVKSVHSIWIRHQGLNLIKGNQEDALWRQTTNGSFLVCDWLVLVLDRLSLAVKRREPRP
ncbi:hypothetical protein YC2023_045230 [Brassica napus]